MADNSEFVDYVIDQLDAIPGIASARFFGGTGLTCDSAQFAMVMGGSLYMVVDDETRPKYEEAKMPPFSYQREKGRIDVRRYYEVPPEVLEDPAEFTAWAEKSIEVARRTPKKPRRKRKT